MSWRAAGLRAWLWQRLTGAYMAAFLTIFGLLMLFNRPDTYAEWRGLLGDGRVAGATALFFGSLLFHAWVGVRDVIIDYIRPFPLRFVLLILVGGGLMAVGLWVGRVLLLATL
jgi:succinate dehydrogenase / fumarate reductase membrane anchor subunit